jgi:hypothetical protein
MTKSINPNMYNALEKERDELKVEVANLKAELLTLKAPATETTSAFEEYPEDDETDDDGA